MKKTITVLQLYPNDMNIYGDNGNVLVLLRRLEWYGYAPRHITYNPGDTLPEEVDIVVGGGGQDSGQDAIHADLIAIGPRLKQWADKGVPMLLVCGLYQLFGHSFTTLEGRVLTGIGVLDLTTQGTTERLIGNIVTASKEFGDIIGYENHSGQTYLGDTALPFAKVIKGAGNNATEGHEGARYNNVIGTYLHGSVLPKNPALADFFIAAAIKRTHNETLPKNAINDTYAQQARKIARSRPR